MANLTTNQVALIQYIVADHKAGDTAKVEVSQNGFFHPLTLWSLVERGLVRHLHYYSAYDKPMPYTRTADGAPVYEVELTSEGWSYLYRIKR